MLEACRTQFETQKDQLPGSDQSWLQALRAAAFQEFTTQGLPTTKSEAWRNTDLYALGQQSFATTASADIAVTLSDAEQRFLTEWTQNHANVCVFVDGVHRPEYSRYAASADFVCTSMRDSLRDAADLWRPYFERSAAVHAPVSFGALNAALAQDGCCVQVPENTVVQEPVYLVSLVTEGAKKAMLHLQHRIVLGAGSQLSLCAVYYGAQEIRYLMNAATHLYVAPGAQMQHYKIQNESKKATHIAAQYYYPDQDSRITSTHLNIGAQLARDEIPIHFTQPRGHCALSGVNVTGAGQQADHYIRVQHTAPECHSHQRYKSIVDADGCAVFNSKVQVDPGAAKTSAHQKNDNRLLAAESTAHTRPQLHIDTDDVQCTHAATVGQIDKEALFYLRSRGISESQARELLMRAFVRDVIAAVEAPPVRALMESMMEAAIGAER